MSNSVDYNLNQLVVSSNDLIKGRQFMPVKEADLIKLIIAQISKDDKDYQTYSCRVKDLASFWGISASNIYRDIKKICRSLMQQVVEITDHDNSKPERKKWKMYHWIETAEYDGEGNVTIRLSRDIKPYVLQLNAWFTQIELYNIINMKYFYSQRIYEILKCDLGLHKVYDAECTYTIIDLRDILCCNDKYKEFSNFKKQVIEKSVREININTDINVTTKYIKTGKSVTSITFSVKSNSVKKSDSSSIKIIEHSLIKKIGRSLSNKEKNLLKKWIQNYGFKEDIILLSCDVCMESIEKYDIYYIDGILKNWKVRNVENIADITQHVPQKRKTSYEPSYNLEVYESFSIFD